MAAHDYKAGGSRGLKTVSKKIARTFRRTKQEPPTPWADNQTHCPLFRLPLELREQIWELALTAPPDAKTPHFHVYEDVWDFCTYEHETKCNEARTQKRQRRRGPSDARSNTKADDDEPVSPISVDVEEAVDDEITINTRRPATLVQAGLISTCRAIYSEALDYLYQDQRFDLVLMAGLARPTEGLEGRRAHAQRYDKFSILKRVRVADIIIQPGEFPCPSAYQDRIAAFLSLTSNCTIFKRCRILFNFYTSHNSYFWNAKPIVSAFRNVECDRLLVIPPYHDGTPRAIPQIYYDWFRHNYNLHCEPVDSDGEDNDDNDGDDESAAITPHSDESKSNSDVRCVRQPSGKQAPPLLTDYITVEPTTCLTRGQYGSASHRRASRPLSVGDWIGVMTMLGVLTVTLPISYPLGMKLYRKEQKMKGQWCRHRSVKKACLGAWCRECWPKQN